MLVTHILKTKGTQVVFTTADETIARAAKLLTTWKIGALVVRDSAGAVTGIVSERDIVRALAERGEAISEMPVDSIMTRKVIFCAPTDAVDRLMGVMTEQRIRHLPVIENGKLTGIVSIGDVVKARIEEAEKEVADLRGYVMAQG